MDGTVVLTHVRHRSTAHSYGYPDPRIMRTTCGKPFVDGGSARDRAVHEPATSRCQECYR